jgi:hypothetical protein
MAARRSKSRVTIDHDEMKRRVESKGGCPASVKGTGRGDDPGIRRVDFPGSRRVETLQRMSWNEWFRWFDKNKLAFVYDPDTLLEARVTRHRGRPARQARHARPHDRGQTRHPRCSQAAHRQEDDANGRDQAARDHDGTESHHARARQGWRDGRRPRRREASYDQARRDDEARDGEGHGRARLAPK